MKKIAAILSFAVLLPFSGVFAAGAPAVSTTPGTVISDTSATFTSFVTPNGAATTAWFQYGTSSANLNTNTSPVSIGTTTGTVSKQVTGLTPGTTYYFRGVAANAYGQTIATNTQSITTTGGVQSVNTLTVSTLPAGTATTTTLILNGFFTKNGVTPMLWFQYGTNAGNLTSFSRAVTGVGNSGQFTVTLTSLTPGTTYYFKSYGSQNGTVTIAPSTQSSQTQPAPVQSVTVATLPVSAVGSTSATLNAFLTNGNAISTTRYFKWGTTAGNLSNTLSVAGTTTSTGQFSATLTGLASGTTYYYKAYAQNSIGTVSAPSTQSFTTTAVVLPCTINSFIATPQTIAPGNSVVLSWSTSNCTGAAIGNIGTVAVNGNATTPTLYTTTSYTLIAGGANGNVSRTVLVTVATTPACTIQTFVANPTTITAGASSQLSWTTSNCTSATISTIGSVVTNGNTTTGALYATTTFTLSASGATGNPTRQVTVYVNNTTYQCNDGIDNDSDGLVDFPTDPGCTSGTDNSELNTIVTYQCNDGIDNDSDGLTDYPSDPGCITSTDNSELNSQNGSMPSVTTNNAINVTTNSATLSAYVNPNSAYTYVWFEYVDVNGTTSLDTADISQGTTVGTVTQSIYNLSANTLYYFRACAINSYGTSCGNILTFTTLSNGGGTTGGCTYNCTTPTVNTQAAQSITANSATLTGYVDVGSTSGTVWFQYGTSNNSYFPSTAYPTNSTVYGSQYVSVPVSNLTAGTTYYFRICASNSYGQNCGTTLSFMTTSTYNQNPYYPPYTPNNQQTIIVYTNTGSGEVVGTSSLAKLTLISLSRDVARGETITYTATLTNTSTRTLKTVEMHVSAPMDLLLISTTDGTLSFQNNSLTLVMPTLAIGASKTITFTARLDKNTKADSFVVHSDASYLNTKTGLRETVNADLITRVARNGLLAAIFGAGASVGSLIGILLVILIILMIFLLAHRATARPQEARTIPPPPTRLPM